MFFLRVWTIVLYLLESKLNLGGFSMFSVKLYQNFCFRFLRNSTDLWHIII